MFALDATAPAVPKAPIPDKPIDDMLIPHCLITDDDMSAWHWAQGANIKCDPGTHFELLSQAGQQHYRKVHTRDYNMLWISIPSNYFHRTAPPGTAPSVLIAPLLARPLAAGGPVAYKVPVETGQEVLCLTSA